MSSIFPIFTEQQRRSDIQAALGGEVWWEEARICWRPVGHTRIIRLDDPGHHESFDAMAWVERTQAEWRRRGVRI